VELFLGSILKIRIERKISLRNNFLCQWKTNSNIQPIGISLKISLSQSLSIIFQCFRKLDENASKLMLGFIELIIMGTLPKFSYNLIIDIN
jgi:hypothetical protein